MPTSKTKELAKKLGLLKRKRKAENNEVCANSRKRRRGQILSYVIVIDFESTCWKDKKGAQEIIEFPAVLLDLQSGEVVDEFQQYVQPQECPVLSHFCKELTGISQEQVGGGVPLPTCLYLFGKWVRSLREEKGVCLMEPGHEYSSSGDNLCALATWSDWDLGVCLQYECRRKQIRKPPYFDQWIDLRIVYKQFYERKPSGLCGSLEDLGIAFTGREHCGLDDARNTAKLCYRLVQDGCKLNITKSLWKNRAAPLIRAPVDLSSKETEQPTAQRPVLEWNRTSSDHEKPVTIVEERRGERMEQPTAQRPVLEQNQPSLDDQNPVTTIEESPTLEEKENPNTLLLYPLTIAHNPVTTIEESPTLEEKENARDNASLEPQTGAQLWIPAAAAAEEREVTSPSDESFLNGIAHEFDELEKNKFSKVTTTTADKNSFSKSLNISKACPQANRTPSRSNFLSHISPVTLLPGPHATNDKTSTATHSSTHQQQYPLPACISVPQSPPVIQTPRSQLEVQQPPLPPPTTTNTTIPHRDSTIRLTERRLSGFRTPSTTAWIKAKSFQSSSSSSILSCESPPQQPFNGGKLTPPLCKCGKRAKRKLVTSHGPNQGRPFFSCPGGRGSGCQYFRWESSSPNRSPYYSGSTGNCSSEYT